MRIAKALVTGAAGFIGSHLCAALERGGVRVVALDIAGAEWWRHEELGVECERASVDLRDVAGSVRLIGSGGFTHVYHLAAVTDVRRDEDLIDRVIDEQIVGLRNVLRAARGKVERVIVAGTCEEYGTGRVPFEEGQREVAVSPYGWGKICCTHLCEMYARIFGAPVVVVRPFLTYGPLQTSEMLVPAAIRAALRGEDFAMTPGEQTREFNYVEDIVRGLERAGEAEGIEGQVINLANGAEVRVADVVEKIYGLCGSKGRVWVGALPYRAGETMHFYGSGARAAALLGWQAQMSLEEGLRRTIAWYRSYLSRGGRGR